MFIAGDYGEIPHHNGSTFKSYQAETGFVGALGALAVKGDLVIAVGTWGHQRCEQPIVVIGRRVSE